MDIHQTLESRLETLKQVQSLSELLETKIPSDWKIISERLLDYGWFVEYWMQPMDVFKALLSNDPKTVDRLFASYLKSNLKEIENNITTRFPERKHILQSAFKAHRRKKWELSIPVLLTQIDGIFREITSKEIFSKRDNKNPSRWLDQMNESNVPKLSLAVLEPLRKSEVFAANFNDAMKYPFMIHRNSILHGYETNFVNETNAYKTLSLLNYISTIVYDVTNKTNGL